jgi:hypothetical protein
MAAHLSEMSNIFQSSCTLLSKVVTTYTTLVTLQLWKVAKVVQSCIGCFPDVRERMFGGATVSGKAIFESVAAIQMGIE